MSAFWDTLARGLDDVVAYCRERDRFHRWGPLICLGFLTIIVAGTFAHVFAGEPCGDDNSHHLGEIARLSRAIRAGDWDWWNPSGNSGFPSGYYYQVVPQAVPAATSALFGITPLLAFQLGIFVPLVLTPAAAYRAMRILGADGWVALGAAIVIPFVTGGDMHAQGNNDIARWGLGADGTFSVGLYTQLWASAAFPLAFAHASRWLDDGEGLAPALGWGLLVGLSHPVVGVAIGVAAFAGTVWVFVRWFARWTAGPRAALEGWAPVPSPGWPAARLAILGALLVVGAACAWLPVLVDYEAFGGFPHRVIDEVGPGFTLLIRWLWKGNLLDYARAPVLTYLLPVVILFARTRWLPRMWAAALIYFLLLGIGPHLGKTGSDDLLPAVRFLPTLQIVLGMAIGGGLVVVFRRVWTGWIALRMSPAQQGWVAASVIIPFLMVLSGGVVRQRERVKVAGDFKGIYIEDMRALMPAIRAAAPGRIQARSGADSHWAVMLPYVYADRPASLVMGAASLQSSTNYAYEWWLQDEHPELDAYAFDAPLVLLKRSQQDEMPEGGEVIAEGEIYEVMQYPSPGLVGPVRVMGEMPAGREAARAAGADWLLASVRNPPQPDMVYKDQVLAHAGYGEPDGGEGPEPHGYTIESAAVGSRITAEVMVDDSATTPTTFAIRESWHPRWTATLDGEPVAIRRITPDFMAIDVPPGRHHLALHFDRPIWTWLLWLLWPAVCLGAWGAARVGVRRRRLIA